MFYSSLLAPLRARRAVFRLSALLFGILLVTSLWPFIPKAALQSNGATAAAPKLSKADFVPGEILVRFRPGAASPKGRAQMPLQVRDQGLEIPLQVEALGETEIVEGLRLARVAPENTLRAIEALKSRPDVLYAEPNYVRRKSGVPNDTQYAQQWSLKNNGQNGGTAGADIHAEQAWNITTGSRNVVVGVVDEGIDINHPDLKDNIWKNPAEIPGNNLDDDGDGYVDDVNGWDFFHNDKSVYDGASDTTGQTDAHGTHVSGTIGALGNNAQGVAGVNWQVSIMSLKILGKETETPAQSSVLFTVQAYSYAKMMRELWISSGGTRGANIRILNNSYGGVGNSQAELDAIRALGQADILFVVAAGNDNESNDISPLYPAAYDAPNLIAVAATDRNDHLSSFSNYGTRTVHLAAPGSSILSTTPNNTYSYYDGTSMATPHVAGAAALLYAAYPNLSAQQVRAALVFSGDELTALDGKVASGRRLNVANALQSASISDATPPLINDFHQVAQEDRHVTLAWTAPGDDGSVGRASLYEIRFVDQGTGAQFLLTTMRTAPAGTPQSITVNVPYKHTAGQLILKAFDKAGNAGTASVTVTVNADAADPYLIAESAATPLSTGGAPVHLTTDDEILRYFLPFNFPFFEGYSPYVDLSTNGAMYFSNASSFNDALSLTDRLAGRHMIAGLWDDLDLSPGNRADANVYVVKPNADSIIFRWQGVPCNTSRVTGYCAGGDPVNFEIELRRDGTIITRYGDGNKTLYPVVGISGGEPEAYVVASHTSEFAPKDLTNAPNVIFTPRRQPKSADVKVSIQGNPDPVLFGQNITYTVTASNAGPDNASGVVLKSTLSSYTNFVSCTSSQGFCVGPTTGSTGTVVAYLDTIASGANATLTIVANTVSQPPSYSYYESQASVSSVTFDPDTGSSSNSASVTTQSFRTNPNPLMNVSALGAGGGHSLAIRPDGSLLAWGTNYDGQLGDGTNINQNIPVFVNGISHVKSATGGLAHTIALKTDGTVWTWGRNASGQLGDGSTNNRMVPAQVGGLSSSTAVAAGASHSVALQNDGTVKAWGDGSSGQLGNGLSNGSLTPVTVQGLTNVVAIACGYNHTIALRSDGTVWTWGANYAGQLGNGSTTLSLTPVQVTGLTGVTAIASGSAHTLAIKSDGTVWAWGNNFAGQLGNGTTTNSNTPVQVSGLTSVTAIAAGIGHSMALRGDGTLWAWGGNSDGELGIGYGTPPTDRRLTPARIPYLSGISSIASGDSHALALKSNGVVYAWGLGSTGQLGDGTFSNWRGYPYEVNAPASEPQPIDTVATPVFSPGGGTYTGPQSVSISCATSGSSVTGVAAGYYHTLALLSDGTLRSWGNNAFGELGYDTGGPTGTTNQPRTSPGPIVNFSNVKAVTAGAGFSVALKNDGTAWAWGNNNDGELGDGSTTNRTTPVQVNGLPAGIVSLSAGTFHVLALRNDGAVWAWGNDQDGELGDNGVGYKTSPVQVINLTGVKAIAARGDHSLALKTDGTVWAWGSNSSGQLGDGTHNNRRTPVQVNGLNGVIDITASGGGSFAVKSDGTVWAWGLQMLPNGGAYEVNTPTQVGGLTGITNVYAGLGTPYALRNDGAVLTWVSTQINVLGNITNPAALSSGAGHNIAFKSDGSVYTWGSNNYGQLGDGTNLVRDAPTLLNSLGGSVQVHYTTNGNDPTESDPLINSGSSITVDHTMTLKAKAWKSGWAASSVKSAVFNIIQPNPIDDAQTFVHQQYMDFLNREPDAGGLGYWTGEITKCGTDAGCIHDRRVGVADAFFFEPEFQQTGAYIYRIYKAAFGKRPTFQDFMSNRGSVVPGSGLDQSKSAYALAFVGRSDFLQLYPRSQTADAFVDALLNSIKQNSNVDLFSQRSALMGLYDGTDNGRAAILKQVSETGAFIDGEYNQSFVLMEYFGYLRRDPDAGGFGFWLAQVNKFPLRNVGIQHAMACSFITSAEYQLRFSSNVTHTNRECPQ